MKQVFFDFNLRKSFPDPELASSQNDYCIGFGGEMSVERLLAAYKKGIFPWYIYKGQPYWFSPDPRCVLLPDELHISSSMKQLIKSGKFTATFDHDFKSVIQNCASAKRKHDASTWISKTFIDAYCTLHETGYAHSVEVWRENKLIGGLYGVSLGKCFFGESMFSKESNASKFAFIFLVNQLKTKQFQLIDCQVYNPHLATLGAETIPRKEFMERLKISLKKRTWKGKWKE